MTKSSTSSSIIYNKNNNCLLINHLVIAKPCRRRMCYISLQFFFLATASHPTERVTQFRWFVDHDLKFSILNRDHNSFEPGTKYFFFTTNLNWGKYCSFPLINPRKGSSLRKHLLIMKTSTGLSTISWSNENRTYFLIGPLSIEGPASLENAFFVPKKFWDLWFPTGQNSVIVASSTFKFKFVNLYAF